MVYGSPTGIIGSGGGGVNGNGWGGRLKQVAFMAMWAVSSTVLITAFFPIGVKSTVVKDEHGDERIMFCPKPRRFLFQDYGTGKLQKGFARITSISY